MSCNNTKKVVVWAYIICKWIAYRMCMHIHTMSPVLIISYCKRELGGRPVQIIPCFWPIVLFPNSYESSYYSTHNYPYY